jgi:hypothetical protein
MGVYDTFVDGKKEIQLKNFGSCMSDYKVGDKIPMRRFGYPENGLFFCFVNPRDFVLIEKSIFKGIVSYDDVLKSKHRIWDCGGNELIREKGEKK